jgi:hypothetical protein
MEKEYAHAGGNGQYPLSSKRLWDMADYSQTDAATQWQDYGKRICLPGSFGITNIHMEMTSDAPPLLSNATLERPGFVESPVNFSGLPETPGIPWSDDSFGTSTKSFQPPPDSWGDLYLQPATYFSPTSGTVNSSEELKAFERSSKTLEEFNASLETDPMLYPGSSMSNDLVHYYEDPETSLTHLAPPAIDYLGLPNASGRWNQHIELGNDMPLMPVKLPTIDSLHLPTGTGFWSQPDQLNTQTPLLQLSPTGVDALDSVDMPIRTAFNQNGPLNSNMLLDATIQVDDCSTEGETSKILLLQPQQLDSLGSNSTPSSISDECSQTSYECSQTRASENLTKALVDDSKHHSHAESLLSIQFEKSTLEKGLPEDCSSFQSQVARNQKTLDDSLCERSEEIKEVGYDTCFGMVRSLYEIVQDLEIP